MVSIHTNINGRKKSGIIIRAFDVNRKTVINQVPKGEFATGKYFPVVALVHQGYSFIPVQLMQSKYESWKRGEPTYIYSAEIGVTHQGGRQKLVEVPNLSPSKDALVLGDNISGEILIERGNLKIGIVKAS
ncbi:hypothetical protein [Flammeovirga agarivorans]|uniref:Uncharacterized protein n=1 Tax=Flammeovirga agarivorans TaxID=2726742 RepID=A0A7X8SR71_9BACT|nr:hypothetical protein [Flammeovirga agarivorans]NLR94905.1 hypothetical protein [Flammeovirga agarivorans]